MRVFIAGKEASLRNALTTLLQTHPGIEIAGAAADKKSLFAQIEPNPSDLLLLDENLSQELVKEVIVPLQRFDPQLMIVVLGKRTDSKTTYLDAGAVAFVSKSDSPSSLLTTIEEVRLEWRRV